MRNNGGRLSWKDWEPSAGMVGHVVHCWTPNHKDMRFRSHVNRYVYLVEIGDHYVPVEELGLREYNQIMGSTEEMANSRRSSIQRDFHEYKIQLNLGGLPMIRPSTTSEASKSHKAKIRAVSSSSSEDEDTSSTRSIPMPHDDPGDLTNFTRLVSMWKEIILDNNKRRLYDMGELSPELLQKLDDAVQQQQQQDAPAKETEEVTATAIVTVTANEGEEGAREVEKEPELEDKADMGSEEHTQLEEVTVSNPEEQPAPPPTPPSSPATAEASFASSANSPSPASLSQEEGTVDPDNTAAVLASKEPPSDGNDDSETGTTV